ncbi:MAG: YfhO family protein [Deltaproteobacteria bacterium]|nr:YfhO family protein [Deltaproteobacteria bacterium]
MAGFLVVLYPRWATLLPDVRWAASTSIGCAVCATLVIVFLWQIRKPAWLAALKGLFILLIYGMFLFGPVQATQYLARHPAGKDLPSNRLSLSSFIGLTSKYSETINQLENTFLKAPSYFSEQMREGRIFDAKTFLVGRDHFHAPHTGFRFALMATSDPASSRYLRQLANLHNPALLDLDGICWTVLPSQKVIPRPSCLPLVFFVPQLKPFASDHEVLESLEKASRNELTQWIPVNCKESDCSEFLIQPAQPFSKATVQTIEEKPGHMAYEVRADSKGLLFLSTIHRPDWKAAVNGKLKPVLRAAHAFMAVSLESGHSKVELSLPPTVSRLGFFISLICTSIAFFGLFWAKCKVMTLKRH